MHWRDREFEDKINSAKNKHQSYDIENQASPNALNQDLLTNKRGENPIYRERQNIDPFKKSKIQSKICKVPDIVLEQDLPKDPTQSNLQQVEDPVQPFVSPRERHIDPHSSCGDSIFEEDISNHEESKSSGRDTKDTKSI